MLREEAMMAIGRRVNIEEYELMHRSPRNTRGAINEGRVAAHSDCHIKKQLILYITVNCR
jgi:hypothetical protein